MACASGCSATVCGRLDRLTWSLTSKRSSKAVTTTNSFCSIGQSAVRNQAIYQDNYSIGKLRERAEGLLEDTGFSDLWIGLTQTFNLFADSNDTNPLEIPPLNGDLFGSTTIPDLETAQLSN